MVLDHSALAQRGEYAAKDVRCLLDDARVGDGVDRAVFVMANRVVQGKREAGKRLAAASRHGEGKHPRIEDGLASALRKDVGAKVVHGRVVGAVRQRRHVHIQRCLQCRQTRCAFARSALVAVHEGLGIEKVGINQR